MDLFSLRSGEDASFDNSASTGFSQFGDGPLPPAWSPDHQILATTTAPQRFVTPEGANYTLLLNGQAVYPKPRKSRWHWFSAYENQHTFLTRLEWSPDSQNIAFFEKVYDWEYGDERGRDFDGWVSGKRYYLAVVSRAGNALGYEIAKPPTAPEVYWRGPSTVGLNEQIFSIQTDPPKLIR